MFGLDSLFGLAGNFLGYMGAKDAAGDAEDRFNAQMGWAREQFDRNEALQREFAKTGIQWRVADAKAAGIHPIFAMGAGGASYSPSVTAGGDNFTDNSSQYLASMGQDIGRAISATKSGNARLSEEFNKLALEKGQLEVDILKADLAKKTAQLGPPLPTDAAGPLALGGALIQPVEVNATQPGKPGQMAGPSQPLNQWTTDGEGLIAMPNKNVGGLDDMDITSPLGMEWFVRNRISPFLGSKQSRPSMEQVRSIFPGATGVYFSRLKNKWLPQYGMTSDEQLPWYYRMRDRQKNPPVDAAPGIGTYYGSY